MKKNKEVFFIFSFLLLYSSCRDSLLAADSRFNLIKTKKITTGDQWRRPDVVLINDQMYASFARRSNFVLARISEDLNCIILDDNLIKPSHEFATDIRLSTDGDNLWYAVETIDDLSDQKCDKNFLNAAIYSIKKDNIKCIANNFHITTGCPTVPRLVQSLARSAFLPVDAKSVDDPTPIFIDGHYVIMARGWMHKKKQYFYKFDNSLNVMEEIKTDFGDFINYDVLSQNVLIDIDKQIYLIAGVSSGPPVGNNSSQIKAFPLSRDMKRKNGEPIDLLSGMGQYFTRVTSASLYKGKLFFNFVEKDKLHQKNKEYIAIVDVKNNFQIEDRIFFQESSIADNHSSFAILNNKIFVFYQDKGAVMAKVFSLSEKKSSQNKID